MRAVPSTSKAPRTANKLAVGVAIFLGIAGWGGWGISRLLRKQVAVYWLTDGNNDIHYVIHEREVSAVSNSQAISIGLNILIEENPQEQLLSAIPEDTKLLNAHQTGDEIFLDFSDEFRHGGGSTSLLGRVTQVLYTATSLAPQSQVWLSVEGELVEVLSGEGLPIDQPLTRSSFPPSFKPYEVPLVELPFERFIEEDPRPDRRSDSSLEERLAVLKPDLQISIHGSRTDRNTES